MTVDIARRVRGLTWFALLGGFSLVALYVVFVRTPIGQRWDDRALLGGEVIGLAQRRFLTLLLHEIRISTIALAIILLLVIGLLRRRLGTALLAVAAFGSSIVAAEILKLTLPRNDLTPELNAYVDNGNIDTYPSGHATIAMGFALALIMVSSPRARLPVAAFAMAWASGVSVAALAAGWHRPSDLAGGMALAVLFVAAAAALATRHLGRIEAPVPTMRWLAPIGGGVFVLVMAACLLWISRGDTANVDIGGAIPAFVAAEIAIALLGIAIVGLFSYALRGVSFDQAKDPARRAAQPIAS